MSASQQAGTPRPPPAWSATSLILFGLILALLLGVGWCERTHQPPLTQGLPTDPAVRTAITVLGGPLAAPSGELRFETSLDREAAGEPVPPPAPTADLQRLGEAEGWVRQAQSRHSWDPRLECLLGHLDLARHRYESAERHYAAAVGRAGRYGEARLGYGVTLALHAETEGNGRRARALTLRAVGQLAAVDARDPFFLPALYDRALLLERVGRPKDAVAAARQYLDLDPRSPWAASLLRWLGSEKG